MTVITIDGPASSGKGTVAKLVAKELGFHYLDSGAIYRVLGLMVLTSGADLNNIEAITRLADSIVLSFIDDKVILDGKDVTQSIRREDVAMMASTIAKISQVRKSLLYLQHNFDMPPGLVADGRDMGSVVFPGACLKIFLTASAEKRACRRYFQLQESQNSATIEAILRDIIARDRQDSERSVSPLAYDSTYKVLDNSDMSIEETVKTIINWYKNHLGFSEV